MSKCVELLKKYKPLLEMANIAKDVHGLDLNIRLQVFQPGLDDNGLPIDNSSTHPRVKVFKDNHDDGFTIPIYGKHKIKGDWKRILSKVSDYNSVITHVEKNKDAYLLFYCSPTMSATELKRYLKSPEKAKKDLQKIIRCP
jgi:hypothetical protein